MSSSSSAPPVKKQRTEESVELIVDMDPIVPVLHDKFSKPLELETVLAAKIIDPKHCKELISYLKVAFPLPHLAHLKRISSSVAAPGSKKELSVLLSSKTDNDVHHTLTTAMGKAGLLDYIEDITEVNVVTSMPLTREQFRSAAAQWPTAFHEDKRITQLLSGFYFSSQETSMHESYMKLAIKQAKLALDSSKLPIGYCVVDPACGRLIASGYDLRSCDHVLRHAVMVAIDMVAYWQGGGALGIPYCKSEDDSIMLEDGEEERSPECGNPVGDGYLCTGFDLYATMEPCIMCSMSLVHSRIGRVFYGMENKKDGGLGSVCKIHVMDGLNHHFDVFKGVCRTNCEELLERQQGVLL